jgi:hypothetical protein
MDTNLIKAFSGLADATRENVYPTDINSKIENLAQKQQEKLSRLGANSQYANLDESYTKLDTTGTIESNKNKIWNDETAAGIQMALGEAMNESVYTRPDGSKYQLDKMGNERDFTGQTERAYLYGTKDNPDAVKFGLATGSLPSSDYRYEPGRANREGLIKGKEYGWDPGENGVDVNKKYLDVELPYQTATALEAMIHGRTDALANRKYPDYLSEEAVNHASGVSEYYNSMEGMLGDSRNQVAPEKSRLEEFKQLAPTSDGYIPKGKAFADTFRDVPEYNQARGVAANTLNVGAKIASLVGEGLQTLGEQDEKFLEREQGRLDKAYPGERVSDWRKNVSTFLKEAGGSLNKEMREFQLNNRANKLTGYDTKDVDELSAEVGTLIKDGRYATALGKALSDTRSLEVLTNSVPEMVALAMSVGGMAVVNVHNNIDLGQAEIGREFTTKEKTMSAVTSIVSTYLDRAGDKLALSGMNEAKGLLKTAVNNAPESVKKALASTYGEGILAIGKAPLRVAGAAGVEGSTEYLQTLGETASRDPKVFEKGFTDAQTQEAAVAGVLGAAAGSHMAIGGMAYRGLKGSNESAEEQAKKIEELVKSNTNEVKTNMETNLDMTEKVDLTERDLEIADELGVDSVNKIFSDTENVSDMMNRMSETKYKILEDVYEYEVDEKGVPQITGIKDPGKMRAVEDWMNEYGRYQADAKGNIPKMVQDEIDYIKNANLTYGLAKPETFTEKATAKVKKDLNDTLVDKTEDEVKDIVRNQVQNTFDEYGLNHLDPEIKENVIESVLKSYGVSGLSGFDVQLDREALAQEARDRAGLKAGSIEQRSTGIDGKVVQPGSVTNEELNAVLEGEGTIYPSDHPNTKFRERILKKLDPLYRNNVVGTLSRVGQVIKNVIPKFETEAGKYFKGGDIQGNMQRLMIIGMNTINGQVASDTEQRANTEGGGSMLRDAEYWASMSSTMEQIGKDYASSYGLKLAGADSIALAKAHRNLGRFAIEMLKDAGLVEVTDDYMWNRAGDVVDSKGDRLISSPDKKGVETTIGKDTLTGKDVLLTKDRGIRLTDTVNRVDENDKSGRVNKYKSVVGDAIKRVSKLMLPNSERIPNTVYVDRPLKVDSGIKIDAKTEKAIKSIEKRPQKLKTGKLRDVLIYLKGQNEILPGGLNSLKSDEINSFLGLKDSGSKLLEVSESGSTMGRLDNLIGILDNLDTLANPDGVYYTVQVDVNNRLTIREGIANYQSDKVYARNIMGSGRYTVTTNRGKEVLVSHLADELGNSSQKDMSNAEIVEYYSKVLDQIEEIADGDTRVLIEVLANTMEEPNKLSHLKKYGGFKVLSMLEGARDVARAGDGPITTEYVPEKDASASGVFNTLMNLIGRDITKFRQILLRLGVKIGDEEELNQTDAYSMLSDVINKMIDDMGNKVEGIGHKGGMKDIDAVRKIRDTLKDPKLMRNLAKYPIMTWFYSAGKESIVENLTAEMTTVLIEKAMAGDVGVLNYLTDITGKEVTAENVKDIKRGDASHRALRTELNKIGEVYYSQLNTAFPEVENNKKEMQEYFEFLTVNGKTSNGKDYWNGEVRTALGALHGTNSTMSMYKWKNKSVNMSAADKINTGLTTEDESLSLITVMERMSNITSLMALMAHSIDAAQEIEGLADVEGTRGIQIKHDGFSGTPDDLLEFQQRAEEVTVEIAEKYDLVNEMAFAMRETAKKMREDLDGKSEVEARELNKKAKMLDDKASEIERVNSSRMEDKSKLLKTVQTRLFGKEGYVTKETETESKPEVKTQEEVRAEAIEYVYKNIQDRIEELDTMDERKIDILSEKEGVTIKSINTNVARELLNSISNVKLRGEILEAIKSGGSFTYKGVAYIGTRTQAGLDELTVTDKQATAQQILDVVSHEIEHAVIDSYIDKEFDKGIELEYKKLEQILNRAMTGSTKGMMPRVAKRIKYVIGLHKRGDTKQAIKELVAISREEEVATEVMNGINKMAGIEGSMLEKVLKAIWKKIEQLMSNTPLKELLDKTDVYTLGVAIKSIQDKARVERKGEGIAKPNDGTMSEYNSRGNDSTMSEYFEKIDPIC